MNDGLKDAHRSAIIAVLAANERVERAVLFGSRAMRTGTMESDVDIALFGDQLTFTDQARLAAALEEIPMAQSVDLVLHGTINHPSLLEHIRAHGIEWYRCPAAPATLGGPKETSPEPCWERRQLGECIVVNESTYSPKEAWDVIQYLDTSNITDNCVSLLQQLVPGTDKIPSRARRKVKAGDILYSTVRPNQRHFGRLRSVPDNFLASTAFAVVRGIPSIADTGFIYWFLAQKEVVEQLHTIAEHSTSAYPSIRPADIKGLTVNLPPLPEQRAIARVLGALDAKIELNRRMSETLEAMARALFKSWFIDFDPVRAKMAGRATGLPKALADLFPNRLADSELGEMPEGWKVATLGDVATHKRHGARPDDIDSHTPYIALEHMPKRSIALCEWGDSAGLASNKFRFNRGEIMFGKLRPYFHKAGVAPIDGVCSTDIVVMQPRAPEWFGFVLCHSSSDAFVDYTVAGSTGTRMPRTSWQDMARYGIVLPLESVAAAFTKLIQPAVDCLLSGVHESHTLAHLRDALLPKLISGEIRVPYREQMAGIP